MTHDILFTLFRTTLILTLCGGICFLVLRRIENQLPHLSRLLWIAVLLTGWCWLPMTISIPVYESREPASFGGVPPTLAALDADGVSPTLTPLDEAHSQNTNATHPQSNTSVTPTQRAARGTERNLRVTPLNVLLTLWLGGMVITILLAAMGYLRILWSLRYTEPAEDALAEPWKKLLTEQGITRTIPMVLSQNVGPALVRLPTGYRLVIPVEIWNELSESGRLGILKHELAHFRRRDVWKSFFVRILTLPHWFNPVAHYAANRFDELAEQLCDREAFTGRREGIAEFARILLLMHENAPTHFVARQSLFGRNLQRRTGTKSPAL